MFKNKSELDRHVGRMLVRAKTDTEVCFLQKTKTKT